MPVFGVNLVAADPRPERNGSRVSDADRGTPQAPWTRGVEAGPLSKREILRLLSGWRERASRSQGFEERGFAAALRVAAYGPVPSEQLSLATGLLVFAGPALGRRRDRRAKRAACPKTPGGRTPAARRAALNGVEKVLTGRGAKPSRITCRRDSTLRAARVAGGQRCTLAYLM